MSVDEPCVRILRSDDTFTYILFDSVLMFSPHVSQAADAPGMRIGVRGEITGVEDWTAPDPRPEVRRQRVFSPSSPCSKVFI